MNEIQHEILDKYQVRKTKKQKNAFIEFTKERLGSLGYEARVEKGSLGARNIVVGDIESARVVYTAHYDTCPRLPFPNFITPKNFSIYLLYQLAIVLMIIVPIFAVSFVFGMVLGFLPIGEEAMDIIIGLWSPFVWVVALWLMMCGPANKHTANDNTSGVTALFGIMEELPEELRGSAAFVFFDLEEVGLFGSAGFASKHKKEMRSKLLINFDCISDGENFLFALRKAAVPYKEKIENAYTPTESEGRVEVLTKGVFYPSDQANFPMGVGACALLSTKKGLLYMNKIHTNKDTIYREENINFFVRGSVRLAELLCDEK